MNKIRISTISLLLGLAGAFTAAAWGAESVMSLISTGEAVQTEVENAKTAMDDAQKQNKEQLETGKKLQAEQGAFTQEVQAWTKQNDAVKQQMTDYKAACQGKQLNNDDYKACKAKLDDINAAVTKVNNDNAQLVKHQSDLTARLNKYNAGVEDFKNKGPSSGVNFKNAFDKEQSWLYQARSLVASEAFQPYAKKANCPDAQKTPKTEDQVMKMSSDILACLKRVSGSN